MPAPTDNDERTHEEQEGQELAGGQMSFFDHLEELRRRIIHSLIAVGVAFGICWYFAADIYNVFSRLLRDAGLKIIQDTITSPFAIEFKMALMAAIFLSAPFLLAQVWLFISPGLL
jgi:sec-independent protein translocase protein TatC